MRPEVIVALAKVATERGDEWRAYLRLFSPAFNDEDDVADADDDCGERYRGEFYTDVGFAEQYADETGLFYEWPATAREYFDVERFARDIMLDHACERVSDSSASHYFAIY